MNSTSECGFSSLNDVLNQAEHNNVNITEIAQSCQSICNLVWGTGNPDLSGVGANASYILQVALTFIFGPIFAFVNTRKIGQDTRKKLQILHDTFVDASALFAIPVAIATIVRIRQAAPLYEISFLHSLTSMQFLALLAVVVTSAVRYPKPKFIKSIIQRFSQKNERPAEDTPTPTETKVPQLESLPTLPQSPDHISTDPPAKPHQSDCSGGSPTSNSDASTFHLADYTPSREDRRRIVRLVLYVLLDFAFYMGLVGYLRTSKASWEQYHELGVACDGYGSILPGFTYTSGVHFPHIIPANTSKLRVGWIITGLIIAGILPLALILLLLAVLAMVLVTGYPIGLGIISLGLASGALYFSIEMEHTRNVMKALTGPEFQDNQWGFGQVISLFLWIPLLVQGLWYLSGAPVDEDDD
ncbi:hypothetical protein BDN72DRAFT_263454 [Pluteus cervinus]|uniref:Uncharacterized protein n=1 Tax=Pluteus cervinus TaxID=181527 RepID=A0ACD3AFP3_9AGAR|nr:hypothetical protein BDN72DRAFT_263454 [Pluteus cervinus]